MTQKKLSVALIAVGPFAGLFPSVSPAIAAFPNNEVTGLAWLENSRRQETFRPRRVMATVAGFGQAYAIDTESDGDLDIVWTRSKDDKIRIGWMDNFSTRPVDANRDWRFDQLQVAQVSRAAKYLTGEPASFEEDDWNGDRVSDQLDIVGALQTGNCLRGPSVHGDQVLLAKNAGDESHIDTFDVLFATHDSYEVHQHISHQDAIDEY